MLKLNPSCELCGTALPANSIDAMICSYECTFCRSCVESVINNVCPNCGGGFCQRPIRPLMEYRAGVSLQHQPAVVERVECKHSKEEVRAFAATLSQVPPEKR